MTSSSPATFKLGGKLSGNTGCTNWGTRGVAAAQGLGEAFCHRQTSGWERTELPRDGELWAALGTAEGWANPETGGLVLLQQQTSRSCPGQLMDLCSARPVGLRDGLLLKDVMVWQNRRGVAKFFQVGITLEGVNVSWSAGYAIGLLDSLEKSYPWITECPSSSAGILHLGTGFCYTECLNPFFSSKNQPSWSHLPCAEAAVGVPWVHVGVV